MNLGIPVNTGNMDLTQNAVALTASLQLDSSQQRGLKIVRLEQLFKVVWKLGGN